MDKGKVEVTMEADNGRGGRYVRRPEGFRSFMPASLPPVPPIQMDENLVSLLSRADQAIGRLDGAAQTLPNPDLFGPTTGRAF